MEEKYFNNIELKEDGKKGIIRIDGIQLKNTSNYKIKRDANIVELTVTISTPSKYFETIKD